MTDEENNRSEEPEKALDEAVESKERIPGEAEETGNEVSEEPEETGSKVSEESEETESDVAEEPADSGVEGKKRRKKLHIIISVAAAAVAVVYLGISIFYMGHYLPNTTINGIDCSSNTVDELEAMIVEEVGEYELVLTERGGSTETIRGTDIGLQVVFDGTLDMILKEQQAFAWSLALFEDSIYNPGNTATYDAGLLKGALAALNCMDTEQMTATADAQIVFSEEGVYEIQPEVYGTYMELDTLAAAVDTSLCSLAETLNLEETECYENPVCTEESEELTTACDEMNALLAVDIAYDMLDLGTIEISKEEMSGWITLGEDFSVSVNEEAVTAFVAEFAEQYDTQYTDHTLKTTWGSTVTISKGSYGWKLDQEAEVAALLTELAAGEDVAREPNYSHTAASHGENDYGDTYVEINLTAQHLYFYKDGALIVESDFVSGNVAKGMSTPTGIYPVTYTERNATLRGDGYATPVSYWMPFNGGVGMHDATWRSRFGGTIYKTNGSHGCINLPLSAAKKIFENISKGDPVLVYTLPGTESSSKTTGSSSGTNSSADTDSDEDADTGEDMDSAENEDGDSESDTDSQSDAQEDSAADSAADTDASGSTETEDNTSSGEDSSGQDTDASPETDTDTSSETDTDTSSGDDEDAS